MDKQEISKEVFLALWKGELINEPIYSEFYIKKNINAFPIWVNLKNIKIEGKIWPNDIKSSTLLPILLDNSNIDELWLDNCLLHSIEFINNSELKKFHISEKTCIENISISNSIIRDIDISTSSAVKYICVNEDCKIKVFKVCDKDTKIETLEILNSTIENFYVENNSTILDLGIRGSSRIAILCLKDKSSFDNITIEKNSTCYNFTTESIFVKQRILINDSFFKSVSLHTNEVIEININNSILQEFFYKNFISTTLNLRFCDIILFQMSEMRTGKDGLIQIIDCHISKLKFDTLYNLSCINIRNLNPLKRGAKFKHDTLVGNINFFDELEYVEIKETAIIILNSDIGKTLFSSDLSKYDRFEFLNSKIIESFIAGSRLPEVSTTNNLSYNILLDQQRIAYNQIKKIYETRGDNVTALEYLAKEMEVYRNQVKNKHDGKIPGESFQLKFNQFTNHHGTQWRKPLILTLCISIFFYLIYYWLLFGFNIDGAFNFKALPYYFEFLNPTHKTDFIYKFDFNNNNGRETIALLFDFASRIIIPLFLYQMIQAFRKYGKK